MLLAFLVGLADIVLVTQGAAPIEAGVTDADHRLISVVQRSASPDEAPRTASLLSSTLTITVPRQLKTRHMSISNVEFFAEDGRRLGSSNLSTVMGSWESVQLPGQDLVQEATGSVPDDSSIPLSPFGRTRITLRATAQEDLGLEPGSRIYAQIEGASGSQQFSIRSDLGLTTASEA
ncbi:MAG: hypothetical protein WD602_07870 [Actinomycetota bacterium]